MLIFISSTLLRQGVCVFHLNRCKTSTFCRGPAHGITTLANEASDVMGSSWRRPTVYLQYIYIYIVPPLGAYKSQLGGTYTLSLLVYTVNVSCDLIYMYMFFIFSFLLVGVCYTTRTFHIKIREVVSVQVCFSCRRRQDDMSPMREPCGKELTPQSTLNLQFYSW